MPDYNKLEDWSGCPEVDENETSEQYMERYDAWVVKQLKLEQDLKARARQGTKMYDEEHGYGSGWSYNYSPTTLMDKVDRKRFPNMWWFLLRFCHSSSYHRDTRWESEFGPNKEFKSWEDYQKSRREAWRSGRGNMNGTKSASEPFPRPYQEG